MNIDFQKKKTSLFFFNKGKDKDLWVSCLQQSYSPLQAVAFFFPQQRYSDPTIWLPFFILSYFSMLPIKVNLGSKSVSCNLWFIFILTEFDLICTHDPIQPTQWNNMDLFFLYKRQWGALHHLLFKTNPLSCTHSFLIPHPNRIWHCWWSGAEKIFNNTTLSNKRNKNVK